jgi:phosphoadenosine phosphosulfate reductase
MPTVHDASIHADLDRLAEAIARAATLDDRIHVIANALGTGTRFSTSLGLEDQAVLHAIATTGVSIDVFTLDTGRHFPETLDAIAASESRYGLKIRVIAPEAGDLETLVARDGINGFRHSIDARKACCDVRKVRPLRRALAGASGWITGLRREQSQGRTTVPFAAFDGDFGVAKVNPIADWSLAQLEAYIAVNDIPVNALHTKGFPSIGCQPCTRAIAPGENMRAGRWWWEAADGKECGLHRRPSASNPTVVGVPA